jgi:hypothetical protein
MVPEPGEWTIPAPLRALLWWPPIAFALAMLQPSAAATVIAATGAGLATLGVLSAAVVRCAPSGHSDGRELAPDPGTSNSTSAAADIVSPRTMGGRPA